MTKVDAAERPAWERMEARLCEAFDELWNGFVDPADALLDAEGTRWTRLGIEDVPSGPALGSEQELREARAQCRMLAVTNEFAINGHENRISYVVGSGHTYRASLKKGVGDADDCADRVQEVLDEFCRVNRWHKRQQEIVRRRDRDGEVFLRLFAQPGGTLRVRFVEPGQVATPQERVGDAAATFGIQTVPGDVEEVLWYYVDGEAVPAAEIQHRKGQVDSNVKRGLPLFYPVRKNLRRAERILRNMSVVAEIQSAIALIRKHKTAARSGVQQFVSDQADATLTRQQGAGGPSVRRYGPGTILDAYGGVEYDFPAAAIDASNFVAILQAELRAIASRLVMPEFMLSSDASNANYASTMVAEGPAVKMFQRLQAELVRDDLEIMWHAVRAAVRAGRLPVEVETLVEIQASPPSLVVRDTLQEAQVSRIEYESGILSPQTWSTQRGLDYDQEQQNLLAHRASAKRVAETGR